MVETAENWLQRTEILLGPAALAKLRAAHVMLAGAGGVGGYAAEALVRAGIGKLTVYDPDDVHPTNLNRQILALHSTLYQNKVEVLKKRLLDINPQLQIHTFAEALTAENIPEIMQQNNFDYVLDAIDSVSDKCFLLAAAYQQHIPVISSMGAGRRLNPAAVQYADISKTSVCQLARAVRSRLRKEYNINRGIECVCSTETPLSHHSGNPDEASIIGSSSFMPGIFGLFLAGRVIQRLAESSISGKN